MTVDDILLSNKNNLIKNNIRNTDDIDHFKKY
jgi:hypothetical protein